LNYSGTHSFHFQCQLTFCAFTYNSWSGQRLFEVSHMLMIGEKFVVDIDKQEWRCRKWTI